MTADSVAQVDVVVPCYNRESSVAASIKSVLDQDYPSFQVFAVDDHSTDQTVKVLETLSDPRLHIVTNGGPKGASGARNWGAEQGTSPYIAFQDSDDIWLPGKLDAQVQRLEQDPSCVACYCAMACYSDGKLFDSIPYGLTEKLEGSILENLLRQSFISTQTVVVRRDVFGAIGGMDPEFQALIDWEFMIRVAERGPIAFVDQILVEQHMSSNSITKSSLKRVSSQQMVLEKHKDLYQKYPKSLAYHHNRISGALRDAGNKIGARKHAKEAAMLMPFNIWYQFKYVFASIFSR